MCRLVAGTAFGDLEDAFAESMHNGEGQDFLVYHSQTPVSIGSFFIISVTHDSLGPNLPSVQ